MSRAVPLARLERVQQIQSRVTAAVGAINGVQAAAAPEDGAGETSAELWLYGVVGGYWWGFNDKSVADQLRGLNVDHITVRLNSPGGDAVQGIAIGNLLRNHKATVTVVVDGLAASAASIIALAGDKVVMSPGAQMMLHDPWFFTIGNAKELRQDADFLDKQGANMASLYARKTGKSVEEMRAVMTAEPDGTWYSDEESVEVNLADEVGTVVAISAAPEPPPIDTESEDGDMAARAALDLEVLITPAARAAWGHQAPAAALPTPKPPAGPSAPGSTTEGGSAVAFTDEQITTMRTKLGLPEDADETTILAALDEALDERAEPSANVPEGHVVIPAARLADLEAGARAGTDAAKRLNNQEREAFLDANRTKFAPANRAAWAAEYDRDPKGTREHFATAPEIVSFEETGHGDAAEENADNPFAGAPDAALERFAAGFGLTKEDLL